MLPVFILVLPDSRNLQFDCGVKVQLGFAAEFSNIMIIYTRILEKPKNIVFCSAQLTDFSDVCWLAVYLKIFKTSSSMCCSWPIDWKLNILYLSSTLGHKHLMFGTVGLISVKLWMNTPWRPTFSHQTIIGPFVLFCANLPHLDRAYLVTQTVE